METPDVSYRALRLILGEPQLKSGDDHVWICGCQARGITEDRYLVRWCNEHEWLAQDIPSSGS